MKNFKNDNEVVRIIPKEMKVSLIIAIVISLSISILLMLIGLTNGFNFTIFGNIFLAIFIFQAIKLISNNNKKDL